MDQYFKIGKFVASFGLKGELVLKHSLGNKNGLKGLKKLFIENRSDNFLPYFIQQITVKNDNELYIKLEDLDTPEQARKLTPKEVWLLSDDFNKYAEKSSAISLLGYKLFNDGEELGEISEVIEQPHQILCTLLLKGKEVMIPIHEASLKKIDKKNRSVHVALPEGLLDIYLE